MNNENGKSLVEVLCCAAIVAALSLFSAPALSAIQEKMVVQTIISEMVADLQTAKMAAIENNDSVVVRLQSHGYSIFVDNGGQGGIAGDYLRQEEESLLIDKRLPPLVSVNSNFFDQRFRFRGIPGNAPGTVEVSVRGNERYKIVISVAGRIRVDKV